MVKLSKQTIKDYETYPSWICHECGHKYGNWPEGHLATFHKDKCGWCGKRGDCTEPRDYSYPPFPIKEETRGLESKAKGRTKRKAIDKIS